MTAAHIGRAACLSLQLFPWVGLADGDFVCEGEYLQINADEVGRSWIACSDGR